MFRDSHFQIDVSPTDHGTHVRVTHLPTGKLRDVDVRRGESVGALTQRLRKEIESELYSSQDFRVNVRHSGVTTIVTVVHKRSGKSRQARLVGRESTFGIKSQLIDELLFELTREGRQQTEGH